MNDQVKELIKRGLASVGISGRDARDARDWALIRVRAAQTRRPILQGSSIVWTDRGRVELVPVDVPLAGPGEVTISVHRTAISVGTEKARFLELPHAKAEYPFKPGYSGAGEVLAVGSGVTGIAVGDHVAASRIFHQSVQTLDARFVHKIAPNVDLADASMIELAIIAAFGVDQGELQGSKSYVVIGAGTIGAIADRIATSRGNGPGTFVAATRSKSFAARDGQAFVTIDDQAQLDALSVDVVLESTSDPDSLINAIGFASPGGRIVLLGSPRGTTFEVPVSELAATGKELVGSHISLLDDDRRRELGDEFTNGLAAGTVQVSDLVTHHVDPATAAGFYRDQITASGVLAAVFDWTLLDDHDRHRSVSGGALPSVRTGGIAYGDAPAKRGSLGWHSHRQVPSNQLPVPTGSMTFAMVGCGEIAIQNASAIKDATNATLARSFDPDRGLAVDLATSFGGSAADTYDEVLADDGVDAVVLCVPHHLHEPLATQAFAAGKHVVIEKPLANSVASAQALIGAATESDGVGSVCFPHRFDERVRVASELIRAGSIGDVTGFALTFYQDKPPSYWVGGYSGRSISDWRTSPDKAGGGVLIMNACHYLDLVFHLTGADMSGVVAAASFEGGRAVEDSAMLSVSTTGGAVGSVTVSSSVRGARYDELRVWGTHGHIEVFPNPRVYTINPTNGITASRWQDLGVSDAGQYRTRYFEQYVTSLTNGHDPDVTLGDGLAVQALIDAAYRSAQTGARVDPRPPAI